MFSKGVNTMKELLTASNGGHRAYQTRATISLWGMTARIQASSAETAGAFCIVESTLPPHYRKVQPHWHAHKSEAFYVIDGALTFTRDDQTFIAQCGSFVLVPPHTVHVYWNSTAAPVTFLTYSTPGGLDCFLAELAALVADQPDAAASIVSVAAQYDQYPPVE
jgi:quercetin dioxygenase-like cupin family protein